MVNEDISTSETRGSILQGFWNQGVVLHYFSRYRHTIVTFSSIYLITININASTLAVGLQLLRTWEPSRWKCSYIMRKRDLEWPDVSTNLVLHLISFTHGPFHQETAPQVQFDFRTASVCERLAWLVAVFTVSTLTAHSRLGKAELYALWHVCNTMAYCLMKGWWWLSTQHQWSCC